MRFTLEQVYWLTFWLSILAAFGFVGGLVLTFKFRKQNQFIYGLLVFMILGVYPGMFVATLETAEAYIGGGAVTRLLYTPTELQQMRAQARVRREIKMVRLSMSLNCPDPSTWEQLSEEDHREWHQYHIAAGYVTSSHGLHCYVVRMNNPLAFADKQTLRP